MVPLPEQLSQSKPSFWKRFALPGKVLAIIFLVLLQLIPLFMIEGLLQGRLGRRDEAVEAITSTWGGDQQIVGAVLTVPFRYFYQEKKEFLVRGETVFRDVETSQVDFAYFLPAHLAVEAQIVPQKRHKGIYQAVVYEAQLTLTGDFAPPDFAPFKIDKYEIDWKNAALAFPVADLRGVQEKLHVRWGDREIDLQPGSNLAVFPHGVQATTGFFPKPPPAGVPLPFRLQLNVRGSDSLRFAPVGIENRVHLTSSWPSPSFYGRFPPQDRQVTPQGFDALWKVSYYGRNFPQQWRGSGTALTENDLTQSLFGVQLLSPVDSYRSVERSIKYGVLLIVLVYLTFFLFEIMARLRLHLFQYALVSAALIVFYLGLLSLSEFLSFGASYAIAAGASIMLVGLYATAILGGASRAVGFTAGLVLVYGALFVILQLEDYALLVGSGLLFVALGAVMLITRKVNWYREGEQA